MGFTREQLGILEAAIAQGALDVNYGDKRVTYRSLNEMLRTRDLMKKELGLAGNSSTKNSNRRFAIHGKGLK
jgi:hypothetical protein